MNGSLVWIRREFGKGCSPQLRVGLTRRNDTISASMALEFNKEDEDFLVKEPVLLPDNSAVSFKVMSRSTSMDDAAGTTSTSDSASAQADLNIDPLPGEHDEGQAWQGWDPQDKQAVEDAERFDDITVGFMDEEHETMRETEVKKNLGKKRRGRRVRD